MSKDIRLNVDINTSDALRNVMDLDKGVDKLNRNLNDIGKNAENLGKASELGGNGTIRNNTGSKVEETAKEMSRFKDGVKSVSDALKDFGRRLNNFVFQDNSTPTLQPQYAPTPTSGRGFGKGISAVATIGAFTKGYLMPGMRTARELESQAMSVYSRTGDYGSDFNQARVNAHKVGSKYGYSTPDTYAIQDALMSTAGFKDREGLDQDTGSIMKFAKTYGLQGEDVSRRFGEQVQKGTYDVGEAEKFANILASSIEANDMVGREDEQVRALMGIQDILTDGKLEVSSEDFKHVASLQASLAAANKNLKGERGAEVLTRADSMVNPQDERWIRLAGYGGQLGTGIDALEKATQLAYEGFSNEEFVKNFQENMSRYNMPLDSTNARMYLSEQAGLAPETIRALIEAIENRDKVTLSDIESERKQNLYGNITDSKAFANEQFAINWQNAQTNVGDVGNKATSPFKSLFNDLPTGIQTLGSAGTALMGASVLGKGVGNVFKTLSGTGAGASAASAASAASSAASGIGKAMPTLGKVAPIATGLVYGGEAISHMAQGNQEGAAGAVGAGIGTLGGMKAGALLGAKAGAFFGAPGIAVGGLAGGIIGGAAGAWAGRKAGQAGYNYLAPDAVQASDGEMQEAVEGLNQNQKRERDLIGQQEQLVKTQQRAYDKFLRENEYIEGKETTGVTSNVENFLNARKQYTQNAESTSMRSDGVGNASNDISQGAAPKDGDYLGAATTKFEASDAGFISSGVGDPNGGKSYGIPQYSTKQGSADSFRNNAIANSEFAKYFEGAGKAGSESFDKAWKAAYEADPEGFKNLQLSHNYKSTVDPLISHVKQNTGVDLNRSRALQEMAYSTATQYNRLGNSILKDITPDMTDEEIIRHAQKYKLDNHQSLMKTTYNKGYVQGDASAKNMYDNIRDIRIPNEEKKLLEYLGQAPLAGYAIGTDYISKDQLAYVHKDEAILNRHEADDYRSGKLEAFVTSDKFRNRNQDDTDVTQDATKDYRDGQLERMKENERQIKELSNLSQGNLNQAESNINLNLTIEGRNADEELINRVSAMIEQAISKVKTDKGIKLNQNFQRVPN